MKLKSIAWVEWAGCFGPGRRIAWRLNREISNPVRFRINAITRHYPYDRVTGRVNYTLYEILEGPQ